MTAFLGFLATLLSEVFSTVILELLKTPARETTIEPVKGVLELPPTSADTLISRMHNWREGKV